MGRNIAKVRSMATASTSSPESGKTPTINQPCMFMRQSNREVSLSAVKIKVLIEVVK